MIPFSLAPLRRCDPKLLVRDNADDRVEAFLLALAVAFNDQKGILLFKEELFSDKPAEAGVSANAGQWRGLELQLLRYLMAHLHELLLLIEKFKDEASGPTITGWMKKADASVRTRWNDLIAIALGKNPKGDKVFRNTLIQIRNNAVSHYYQPKALVAGFRRHFYVEPRGPMNEHAYASTGRNMEHTRFYFADAAVQRALATMAEKAGEKPFAKRLVKVSANVNHSLAYILKQWVNRAERR